MAKRRAWLTGDSLAGSTSRVLNIPGDLTFVMAVTGALYPLTEEYYWEKFGTVEPADAALAMRRMLLDYLKSKYMQADSDLILFGATAIVKTGNAIAQTLSASARFNGYWIQNPAAISDSFFWRRYMAAGDWAYRLTYLRNTNAGIFTLSIEDDAGIPLSTNIDMFGAALFNVAATGTFTITKGGLCDIVGLVASKNAGSSSYFAPIMSLELWRTADP